MAKSNAESASSLRGPREGSGTPPPEGGSREVRTPSVALTILPHVPAADITNRAESLDMAPEFPMTQQLRAQALEER